MQFYLAHLGLAIFDLSNDILFASLGSCVLPVIMYIVSCLSIRLREPNPLQINYNDEIG